MRINRLFTTAALLIACLAPAGVALGAPTSIKDVGDFKYFWGFDNTAVPNANFNLYDNTTGAAGGGGTGDVADWRYNTSTANFSISGGAMVIDEGVRNENFMWRDAPDISATSGFTQEYRIRINDRLRAGATAARGLTIDVGPGGTAATAVSFLLTAGGQVEVHWTNLATDGDTATLKATVPGADYFTVRVAAVYDAGSGEHEYSLYVNDGLVAENLAASVAYTTDRMFVGTVSNAHGGNMSVDYLAFTPGGFASVPEPAAAATLVGAGAAMLLRRR